jgi:predicted transcriptional regulator
MAARMVRIDQEKAVAARKRAGLTQADVARTLDMTQPWLCQFEQGNVPTRFWTVIAYGHVIGEEAENLIQPGTAVGLDEAA